MKRLTSFSLAVLLLQLGLTAVADADTLPPAQIVTYTLLTDPADPNSDPAWHVTLEITPIQQVGRTIRWQVDRLEVRELASGGVWESEDPNMLAESDDWTVAHASSEWVASSDFWNPPAIHTTAHCLHGAQEPLSFRMSSERDTGSALLRYSFASGELVKENEEEPLPEPVQTENVSAPTR